MKDLAWIMGDLGGFWGHLGGVLAGFRENSGGLLGGLGGPRKS